MTKKTSQSPQEAVDPSAMPLFYSKPTALDKSRHALVSLVQNISFAFAANVNAVPVTTVELPDVMQFYPIAFSASRPATPLAILGLRANENLFVNEKGEWLPNTYIPAYIRRYPFIFARNDAGDRLTLCVDDAPGILEKSDANRLFTGGGELTKLTMNALEFCRSYQAAAEQTTEFANHIEQSGILVDRHAEVRLQTGQSLTLSGFRQVDEVKYYALADDIVLQWHKNRWTRFVYAHLLSTGNWNRLFTLMEQRLTAQAA